MPVLRWLHLVCSGKLCSHREMEGCLSCLEVPLLETLNSVLPNRISLEGTVLLAY